jgi:hypothetical protein
VSTQSGRTLEDMAFAALTGNGYRCERQVKVPTPRFGGGTHKVDIVAHETDGRAFLVSVKWQDSTGTAEQKVPFEAICLIQAILAEPDLYERAYLVLAGEGWTLKDFYTSGGLMLFLNHTERVMCLSLDAFIGRVNRRQL